MLSAYRASSRGASSTMRSADGKAQTTTNATTTTFHASVRRSQSSARAEAAMRARTNGTQNSTVFEMTSHLPDSHKAVPDGATRAAEATANGTTTAAASTRRGR